MQKEECYYHTYSKNDYCRSFSEQHHQSIKRIIQDPTVLQMIYSWFSIFECNLSVFSLEKKSHNVLMHLETEGRYLDFHIEANTILAAERKMDIKSLLVLGMEASGQSNLEAVCQVDKVCVGIPTSNCSNYLLDFIASRRVEILQEKYGLMWLT